MDYEAVETATDVTFASGTTYLISDQVYLDGTTTFSANPVIKYDIYASLTVSDTVSGYEAIFTSKDDDSVGDVIEDSSGSPGYNGVNALDLVDLNANVTFFALDFRYCGWAALFLDSDNSYTFTSSSTSFRESPYGYGAMNCGNGAVNLGNVYICNINSIASGPVSMSSLSNCDTNADTNGNGIPDWWEVQYFHNLNHSGSEDYDGDGVSNLNEYLNGTDPTRPDPLSTPGYSIFIAEPKSMTTIP